MKFRKTPENNGKTVAMLSDNEVERYSWYKATEVEIDDGNMDRTLESGSYAVNVDGQLVDVKVEIKATEDGAFNEAVGTLNGREFSVKKQRLIRKYDVLRVIVSELPSLTTVEN